MKNQTLNHFIKLSLLLALLGFQNFMACSDDDNPTESQKATVTGTLTLPAEATGKTWAVIFDNDVDGDNGFAKLGTEHARAGWKFPIL